jgi:hypothetical protein
MYVDGWRQTEINLTLAPSGEEKPKFAPFDGASGRSFSDGARRTLPLKGLSGRPGITTLQSI